jgi:hypothetical protein
MHRASLSLAVRSSFGAWLGLALAGCSGGVVHPPYAPQPQSALVEVTAPPPPGRVEVVPPRPKGASAWVDGEWAWRRRRWSWTPGRWVARPAGALFSPWVFERGPDGRFWYAPGVWRDAKGAAVSPPPAILIAKVDSAAIVNASGIVEDTGITAPARTPGKNGP